MLQIFFAVAFSAVPLTLYVPPIRSLNLFLETIEELLRQSTSYTIQAYPRIRLAFSRLFSNLFRLSSFASVLVVIVVVSVVALVAAAAAVILDF
ncbi:conserved hypothetical protein [Ricinus communis]|uniref:Uncharacterized protein n=1 Tax=Ricinus communis TaxID=3988 RepID=B9SL52_RICCO|nr:conserved hypothetical protein [Ricinus communis]